MRLKCHSFAVVLTACSLVPAALGSESQFSAKYTASWLAYVPGPGYSSSNYDDVQVVHQGTAFLQYGTSEATSGSDGRWDGLSIAGPGLVRLSVSGRSTSTVYGENATLNASVTGDIDDFFTPMSSNPADMGKEVTISGSFAVSGLLAGTENGHTVAFGNYNVAVGAASFSASGTGMETSPYGDNTFGRVNRQTDNPPVDEPLVTTIHVTLTGRIGQEMEMHDTFRLGGTAAAYSNLIPSSPAEGTFDAELQHTIAWAGISSAVDGNGRAFDGFSMISANTGIDYAKPVPEPASCLALGLGIAAYGRRRKSAGTRG